MKAYFMSSFTETTPLRVSIFINSNFDCVYFYFPNFIEFSSFLQLYSEELSSRSLYVNTVDKIPTDCVNPYYLLTRSLSQSL